MDWVRALFKVVVEVVQGAFPCFIRYRTRWETGVPQEAERMRTLLPGCPAESWLTIIDSVTAPRREVVTLLHELLPGVWI